MASPVVPKHDSSPNKPYLHLEIEPESKHRFRYSKSDNGSHGVITGKKSENGKKTFPTVKLVNYSGTSNDILIRVSLCTKKRTEHVHEFKQKKSSEHRSCIVALNDDFCAVFQDLSIIIPGNKNKGHEILMNRKIEKLGKNLSQSEKEDFEKKHIEEVKKEYKEILHSVVLRFDALEKRNLNLICDPLYSDTISDENTPCNGELKICHMTKHSGSWKGEEEVVLLCEKIQKKNVKIKFFETDVNENAWEEYASIDLSNIHHQVAIKFKTPPYKANIEKTVAVCLEQENVMSEPPEPFTYLPEEAPCNGELKICHMTKITGSCKGDDDVVILCEKLKNDNVKIKFFETDDGNEIIWVKYASFSISDIHHQVAIKFKTPRYEANIEKRVFVCLEQGNERSAPLEFTYIPEDCPSKGKKCVSEETVNLIPNPEDISSLSCNSDEMLYNILNEPKQLLESLEEILKNDENLSNFPTMRDSEMPSSVLDPESLRGFSFTSFVNFLCSDNEDDSIQQPVNKKYKVNSASQFKVQSEQAVNQSYPFSPSPDNMDGVMIDGVMKLAGKMAVINIEDAEFSVEIPKEVSKKESMDKMLKEQKEIEKFLPFLSNRDRDGNSFLHLAVLYNKNIRKVLCMNKMLESNIINAINNNKQTALHIAVENNSDTVIKLLECFADPNIKNADGNNCYHIACHHDFAESLMCMTNESYGCELGLNDFNYEGLTPLHVALKNYSPACLDFLLKKCNHLIDFSLVESNLGKSFLHYAVEYSPTYVHPLLKETKIEINTKDFEGRTPLLIAFVKRNYNLVRELLSAGADPEIGIPKTFGIPRGILGLMQASSRQASLRQASDTPPDFNGFGEESDRIFKKLAKNLSDLLDPDMKWKKLATYVMDEKLINSLMECSKSPTTTLLEYMKKKIGAQYIEHLIAVLEWIGFSDAVIIATESCQPSTVT